MKSYIEFINESHDKNDLYYHGSFNKFDEFVPGEAESYNIPTYHFTKNINYAKHYGDIIYVVKLNIGDSQIFDTRKKEHMDIFIESLDKYNVEDKEKCLSLFKKGLPEWMNDFAYYCAWKNQFQGILVSEEDEEESIAIFNKHKIKIIKREKRENIFPVH